MASGALAILKEKFTSGNDIPVERAIVTLEEYRAVMTLIHMLETEIKNLRQQRNNLQRKLQQMVSDIGPKGED